ncbi:hypothetical protein JCM16303_002684 [Sporobolomyces ruberrimus]
MSNSTHIRQPSTVTTSLARPDRGTENPAMNQSTNTLPSSTRLARPLPNSITNTVTRATHGPRRVSGTRPLGTSSSSSCHSSSSGSASIRKPRRIVLHSVQENEQDQTASEVERGNDSIRTKPSSIRPPSRQTTTNDNKDHSTSTASRTPLSRSTLSRSTSSSSRSNALVDTPGTTKRRDRPSNNSSRTALEGTTTATSHRILSTSRVSSPRKPSHDSTPSSTTTTRTSNPASSSSSSSSSKPSLLNRSTTSSSLCLSKLPPSSTTSQRQQDSPLERSTTTATLNPSMRGTLRKPFPPRIPIPTCSSSTSTSSRNPLSSSSLTTISSSTLPRSFVPPSSTSREPSHGRKIGLGFPPPASSSASSTTTTRGSSLANSNNTRIASSGRTAINRGRNSRTPLRSSTLLRHESHHEDQGEEEEERGVAEGEKGERDSRNRKRESWETVRSQRSRTVSNTSSTISTTTPRIPSTTTSSFPGPVPVKDEEHHPAKFNAILLSPPRHSSTIPSSTSNTTTTPLVAAAVPENRQLSLLRSSSTPSSEAQDSMPTTTGGKTRPKPRGSTTLEELLQNGLFSSPLITSASSSKFSRSLNTPGREGTGEVGKGGDGGGDFEFLMDEEVSRIMFEEINGGGIGRGGGGGAMGTPWRGRVVSLSMSGRGRGGGGRESRKGLGEEEGDISFEFIDQRAKEGDEREPEGEGEGQEGISREILVLQRVGEQELEELRKEKEALLIELDSLKRLQVEAEKVDKDELEKKKKELEVTLEREREAWESEKKEFERILQAFQGSRGGGNFEFRKLEVETAWKTCQASYEQVEADARREREEVLGAIEGLRVIQRGLRAWEEMC